MQYKTLISFLLSLTCHTITAQEPTYTNAFGMQYVLIKPGSMTVGKFEPTVGKVNFDGKPLPEKLNEAAAAMEKKDAMPGFNVKSKNNFILACMK